MDAATACGGTMRDRAQVRRRRIIDAARTLFVDNGFHATGVAQIAKASGVAIGQIYRDFEAKEEIVAAIVEGDCHAFLERESLRRAVAAQDGPAVWAWLRQVVSPADPSGTEPLIAEIMAESTRNARIAAIFARTQEEVGGDMLAALAVLAPGERFAHRRALLAEMVLAQSLGLMQHRLLRPGIATDELVEMILAIIAAEIAAMRG
jgi:AcrR family transcriptional regulator